MISLPRSESRSTGIVGAYASARAERLVSPQKASASCRPWSAKMNQFVNCGFSVQGFFSDHDFSDQDFSDQDLAPSIVQKRKDQGEL